MPFGCLSGAFRVPFSAFQVPSTQLQSASRSPRSNVKLLSSNFVRKLHTQLLRTMDIRIIHYCDYWKAAKTKLVQITLPILHARGPHSLGRRVRLAKPLPDLRWRHSVLHRVRPAKPLPDPRQPHSVLRRVHLAKLLRNSWYHS